MLKNLGASARPPLLLRCTAAAATAAVQLHCAAAAGDAFCSLRRCCAALWQLLLQSSEACSGGDGPGRHGVVASGADGHGIVALLKFEVCPCGDGDVVDVQEC